jgi:hypothetical protein
MIDRKLLGLMVSPNPKKIDREKFDHPENYVPKGMYCYDGDYRCPFWDVNENKDEQRNGYCHLLKKGDWEDDGTDLLWDKCKECAINIDDE